MLFFLQLTADASLNCPLRRLKTDSSRLRRLGFGAFETRFCDVRRQPFLNSATSTNSATAA